MQNIIQFPIPKTTPKPIPKTFPVKVKARLAKPKIPNGYKWVNDMLVYN